MPPSRQSNFAAREHNGRGLAARAFCCVATQGSIATGERWADLLAALAERVRSAVPISRPPSASPSWATFNDVLDGADGPARGNCAHAAFA